MTQTFSLPKLLAEITIKHFGNAKSLEVTSLVIYPFKNVLIYSHGKILIFDLLKLQLIYRQQNKKCMNI